MLEQMCSYRFRTDLEPIVIRAEAEILRIVQAVVPNVELKRIGPLGTDTNASLSCRIVTATEVKRDLINRDSAIMAALWKVSSDAGFAPDSFFAGISVFAALSVVMVRSAGIQLD